MKGIRAEPIERDAAMQVRQRMQTRGKRRFVKQLLARNAQWRRMVAGGMAAAMATALAGLLVLGEASAMVA